MIKTNQNYIKERTEFLLKDMHQSSLNDKVIFIKKVLSMMQSHIKQAELSIQSLQSDKETLKSALASSVKKKEEIYNALLEYKSELKHYHKKCLYLESKVEDTEFIKKDFEKIEEQLRKRNEKIHSLQKANMELEALVEEQGITSNLWKTIYKQSQKSDSSIDDNLEVAVEILVQKIRENPVHRGLFKRNFPCVSYFKELIEKGSFEEALIRIFRFCEVLMKELDKNLSFMSPGISEIQPSMVSFSSKSQPADLKVPFQADLQDFRQQSSSKPQHTFPQQIVTNHSKSQVRQDSKPNLSISSVANKTTPLSIASGLQQNISPRPSRHLPTQSAQIRIIRRPGSKTAKALPKPSILKRTE